MKRALFIRHFTRLFGGHIRHWHYYNHVKRAEGFEPLLFIRGKVDRADNPWRNEPRQERLDLREADILLLGGMSWADAGRVPRDLPVINLIQGVQHSEKPRSQYLGRRAIRVCMSTQIAQIIEGRANGPVHVINPSIGAPICVGGVRDIPVLVVGHKRKPLAKKIAAAIPEAKVLTQFIPRRELLTLMRRSKIVVGLPKRREGFYLPALEAMCSGALVICPDCVGNRELCTDRYNCLQPIYAAGYIIESIKAARSLPQGERRRLLDGGLETARRNRPEREYGEFLPILEGAIEQWKS